MTIDFNRLEVLKSALAKRHLKMSVFEQSYEYWDERNRDNGRGLWLFSTKTKFTTDTEPYGIYAHEFLMCSCNKKNCKASSYGEGIAWIEFTEYHSPSDNRIELWTIEIKLRAICKLSDNFCSIIQKRAIYKKYPRLIIGALAECGLLPKPEPGWNNKVSIIGDKVVKLKDLK